MVQSRAAKSLAIDFHIDPDAVTKARKELDRITLKREQEQGKAQPQK
jgi:hypothetical protein